MRTPRTAIVMLLIFAALTFSMFACTPAQLQKADATQANIDSTATDIRSHAEKAAPVVQADIVKATPYINTAVDIGLTVTGNGGLVPLNDAATAIIEKEQAKAALKAATTTPATAALPTTPTTATSP